MYVLVSLTLEQQTNIYKNYQVLNIQPTKVKCKLPPATELSICTPVTNSSAEDRPKYHTHAAVSCVVLH